MGGWSCSQANDAASTAPTRPTPPPSSTTHGGSAGGGGGSPGLELTLGGSSNDGQGGSAVCNAQVREGTRVPVDMYFLVDSSGSMNEPVTGGSKWEVVSSALRAFLKDPRNDGTGVGIGYFPSAAQTSCTPG